LLLLKTRPGSSWWAIFSAQNIQSIDDLTWRDRHMAVWQIRLKRRLMKLPPSRTSISILCFACKEISSKISSRKLLVLFLLAFYVLLLSDETSCISVKLKFPWYNSPDKLRGIAHFWKPRELWITVFWSAFIFVMIILVTKWDYHHFFCALVLINISFLCVL